MIALRQKDGIAHLAKWFNTSLGKLHVTAVKRYQPSWWFSVQILRVIVRQCRSGRAGAIDCEVRVKFFTSSGADPVEIDVHQTDCKMVIRVCESHLDAHKPVLTASVDVRGSCTKGRQRYL